MTVCRHAEEWLTLAFLPGIGRRTAIRLVRAVGGPEALFTAPEHLRSLVGAESRITQLFQNKTVLALAREKAQQELDRLAGTNYSLLHFFSPEYPESLRRLIDSPLLLYCHGQVELLQKPGIALVGARNASEYGCRVSRQFAKALAVNDFCVVSGGAYGIDAAAHAGALETGRTIAVLGCGVDRIYPKKHGPLFAEIAEKGLLLSEYPLSMAPRGYHFPERNRLISGLARAVLVVEASLRSGSLITARLALEEGKDIFAIPGRIDSPRSKGTHRLIQEGAGLVQHPDEMLEALTWFSGADLPATDTSSPELSAPERNLLQWLDVYPIDIDTLGNQSGIAVQQLHILLLQLELKGVVRQLPGQRYEQIMTL